MDTHQQKISYLRALHYLATADNLFTELEAVYIRTVAEYLGVDLEELGDIDGTEPELELPDTEYKLYSLFHRLVIVIMIDDHADEKETQYCFNLGIKMGLHPNAVGEIIDFTVARGIRNALPEEILAIFKKYLN